MDPDETPAEAAISLRAFARARGVTLAAIQRAITDGRIVRGLHHRPGKSTQIIRSIADAEMDANTDPAQSRAKKAPDSDPNEPKPTDDYRKVLVFEKVQKGKLAELKLRQNRGELISAAEVASEQFGIARLVQTQLLELPQRLASEIALESNPTRVRAILNRELRDILLKMCGLLRDIKGGARLAKATTRVLHL